MRSFECYIKPAAGENTQVSVSLPPSGQAVISGTVLDGGEPAAGALVLLMDQATDQLVCSSVNVASTKAGIQKEDGQVRIVELDG